MPTPKGPKPYFIIVPNYHQSEFREATLFDSINEAYIIHNRQMQLNDGVKPEDIEPEEPYFTIVHFTRLAYDLFDKGFTREQLRDVIKGKLDDPFFTRGNMIPAGTVPGDLMRARNAVFEELLCEIHYMKQLEQAHLQQSAATVDDSAAASAGGGGAAAQKPPLSLPVIRLAHLGDINVGDVGGSIERLIAKENSVLGPFIHRTPEEQATSLLNFIHSTETPLPLMSYDPAQFRPTVVVCTVPRSGNSAMVQSMIDQCPFYFNSQQLLVMLRTKTSKAAQEAIRSVYQGGIASRWITKHKDQLELPPELLKETLRSVSRGGASPSMSKGLSSPAGAGGSPAIFSPIGGSAIRTGHHGAGDPMGSPPPHNATSAPTPTHKGSLARKTSNANTQTDPSVAPMAYPDATPSEQDIAAARSLYPLGSATSPLVSPGSLSSFSGGSKSPGGSDTTATSNPMASPESSLPPVLSANPDETANPAKVAASAAGSGGLKIYPPSSTQALSKSASPPATPPSKLKRSTSGSLFAPPTLTVPLSRTSSATSPARIKLDKVKDYPEDEGKYADLWSTILSTVNVLPLHSSDFKNQLDNINPKEISYKNKIAELFNYTNTNINKLLSQVGPKKPASSSASSAKTTSEVEQFLLKISDFVLSSEKKDEQLNELSNYCKEMEARLKGAPTPGSH